MTGKYEANHPLIREILVFLDDSIVSTRTMMEQLNMLRAAVVRRDETALHDMHARLPEIAAAKNEDNQRLRRLCAVFAGMIGCSEEEVNLTRIGACLEPYDRSILAEKQRTLQSLVARLALEHRATESLLRECERLNRVILSGIVGTRNQSLTYTQNGQARREIHLPMVSTRM